MLIIANNTELNKKNMDAVGIDTSEPSQVADDEPVDSSGQICRVCLTGNIIMKDLFIDEDEIVSLSTKAMAFSSVQVCFFFILNLN